MSGKVKMVLIVVGAMIGGIVLYNKVPAFANIVNKLPGVA